MFRLCVMLFLGFVLVSPHAMGQESYPVIIPGVLPDAEPEMPGYSSVKSYESLPPEIQGELADEAQKVYDDCTFGEQYSQFHDCECIAVQYLDKRILAGPDATEGQLMSEISGSCVNKAGVAGYYYPTCHKQFSAFIKSLDDLDKFCICYANTMAKKYAEQPSLYRFHLRNLTGAALSECRGSYFTF
jgi:hypothetical protein